MAHDHAVLVLQGGGALGAFHAGVYEPRMVYAVSDHGAYRSASQCVDFVDSPFTRNWLARRWISPQRWLVSIDTNPLA